MIPEKLDYAKEACINASEILLKRFENKNFLKTWFKEKGALVTEADIASDNKIREILLTSNLGSEILSEESKFNATEPNEYKWLVDPLCGTVPYSMGLPHWGVSVSLIKKDNPYLGVLSLPALREMIWNDEKGNVYRNDEILNINPQFPNIKELTIGLEIDGGDNWSSLESSFFKKLNKIGQINSFASAVYPAFHVLTGKMPAVIFFDISPVHIAGFLSISQNLGLKCTNFSGEDTNVNNKNINQLVLAWPSVHEKLLKILN